jgi:hypothetical protein
MKNIHVEKCNLFIKKLYIMSIIDEIIEYANKNTKYGKCIVIPRKQFVQCHLSSNIEHIAYVEKYAISNYVTNRDTHIIKKYNNLQQYEHTDKSFTQLEKSLFRHGYACKIIVYNGHMLNWMSPTYYIFIAKIVSRL